MTTPRTAAGRMVVGRRRAGLEAFDEDICSIESEAATAALESRVEDVARLLYLTARDDRTVEMWREDSLSGMHWTLVARGVLGLEP